MVQTKEAESLVNGGHTTDVPATSLLAAFVSDARPGQLTPAIKDKVKEGLLDYGKYLKTHVSLQNFSR